ncbi:MAG: hypothetical protein HY013_15245 [Candidatus Solibacter usitatus]|nr:hypothetical protein [Candidatus Solibacter usitatus]
MGGEWTEMTSPTEGEVVEVNPEVVNDPTLLREDPYGKVWLMTVHVPDEEATTRNLVPRVRYAVGCRTRSSASLRGSRV